MTAVVWVLALLAALVHIVVFAWESLLFHRPGVHRRIFLIESADVPAVGLWAFCVGFYNLFLALGMVGGVWLWAAGEESAGRILVVYICLFMALGALVLLVADRRAMGRPRGSGVGGVVGEGALPLAALVVMAL